MGGAEAWDALGPRRHKFGFGAVASGIEVSQLQDKKRSINTCSVSKGGHRKITESGTQCIPRRAVLTERRVWCDRLVYKCTIVWGRTGQNGAGFGETASVRAALSPVEKCMPMHANSVIRQTVRR